MDNGNATRPDWMEITLEIEAPTPVNTPRPPRCEGPLELLHPPRRNKALFGDVMVERSTATDLVRYRPERGANEPGGWPIWTICLAVMAACSLLGMH